MGVFKKLSGNDVRVTPIQVKYNKNNYLITQATGSAEGFSDGKLNRSNITGVGTGSEALLYSSIRQLFYGPFLTQTFITSESIFNTNVSGTVAQKPNGVFSRFDPSFQGSLSYLRYLPTSSISTDDKIIVTTIPTKDFGESIVAGTVVYSTLTDDTSGNLIDSTTGDVYGNIFYDQGIIVTTGRTGSSAPMPTGSIDFQGSYTVYNTQYKCTVGPNEFNFTMNPTLLSSSNVDYDPAIINSPDFMPYVTTIGLYNENQELMMVAKLSKPNQLNSYTDTNFIIRLDR